MVSRRCEPPDPTVRAAVLGRLKTNSVRAVARELDASPDTIARLAGDLPVSPWTNHRLREQLGAAPAR